MSTISLPRPKYNYFVQIKDHSELVQDTIDFLESHATKPLNEISVEEINEFLCDSYRRADWAGEAYNDTCKPGFTEMVSY
jgi:hypothetical protein